LASTTRRRRSTYDLLPRWVTKKRVAVLLIVATLGVVTTYGVRLSLALGHAFHTNPISAVIGAISGGHGSTVAREQQNLQRINIMLYGYGGTGHDGAYLTDSIMLVSIQPVANGQPLVAEISIPRDWYVPLEHGPGKQVGYGRINQAYSDGMNGDGPLPVGNNGAGAATANATIEHLLGINVDHWVGIDFDAFKQAVDAVGGVDVNVPNTFTDTQYPHGECDQGDCSYETVHFNAGPQHMDGATALIFARSRHGDNGEGSDFARSRRQQLVVAALKVKVVSIGGIGNLPDLLNALGDHVLTDLQIGDVESLYGLVKDVDPKTIEHVSLDDTNFLYECGYPYNCGAYYIYSHDQSFQTVSHFIQNVFPWPAALVEKSPVTFLDGSGRGQGASGRWAQIIGQLGLSTTDGGAAPVQNTTSVIDESGGKDAQTAKWLATYYGVQVVTQAPPPAASGSAPSNPGVIVVLGTGEENSFLGNPGVGS